MIKNIFEGWSDIDFGDQNSWPATFKIFGGIIIAIAIIYAVYHFKVIEQRQVLQTSIDKEKTLKDEFLEKKALAINLEAYKQQKKEAEDLFAELKEQLPSETEIPDLLVDVTQLGLSRGLIFEQFEPRAEVPKDFYKEKPVQIIVSGNYHEMANFMSDIAALSRIVNVNDFKISRRDDPKARRSNKDVSAEDVKQAPLMMNALIKTYYYEEEK